VSEHFRTKEEEEGPFLYRSGKQTRKLKEKKGRKAGGNNERGRLDAFPVTLLFPAFRFVCLPLLVVYLCLFGLETSYLKPLRVQRYNTWIGEKRRERKYMQT
jgi:hypothetical protein